MSEAYALEFMLVAPEPAAELERRLAEICKSAWALSQREENRFQVKLNSSEDMRVLLGSFRAQAA